MPVTRKVKAFVVIPIVDLIDEKGVTCGRERALQVEVYEADFGKSFDAIARQVLAPPLAPAPASPPAPAASPVRGRRS